MIELAELHQVVSNRRQELTMQWDLPRHLGQFSDALVTRPPRKTVSAFALPYSRSGARPDWAKIVAFGRFRIPFSVIEELAKLLAPQVVQTGVVPVILPIEVQELRSMTWRTPIIKSLRKYGVALFEGGLTNER
ncbi:hypothetical protein KBY96_14085 [Cyanobium sp. ATX 6A2]|uniref:hypothetical protein n=1 Tax=Cyanobium sp. ATX 6A2 TaxID=2823700 RepID=UPI0020CF0365|nr:hypothetical protein [Cyanobium sp. ATX 6A2]MCP9889052.1 hypothetical protein [Cyanobium sp. ATX 6A2]